MHLNNVSDLFLEDDPDFILAKPPPLDAIPRLRNMYAVFLCVRAATEPHPIAIRLAQDAGLADGILVGGG